MNVDNLLRHMQKVMCLEGTIVTGQGVQCLWAVVIAT